MNPLNPLNVNNIKMQQLNSTQRLQMYEMLNSVKPHSMKPSEPYTAVEAYPTYKKLLLHYIKTHNFYKPTSETERVKFGTGENSNDQKIELILI